MKILILGATGFIGGLIARSAAEAGWQVHGLRRREGAVGAVGDLPILWHHGNLTDRGSLTAAMQGCQIVYHAAGYYPTTEHRTRQAVEYAQREISTVLDAVRLAQVDRLIYTSSLSTIGKAEGTRLADERDQYVPGSAKSAYFEAKWVMEQAALTSDVPTIVLIPSAVFGPYDIKPTTSEIVLHIARKRVPIGIDVGMNFIDGRDVAAAHLTAATMGEIGQRYIIAGHNLNVNEMIRQVAEIAEVKPPRWVLSHSVASRIMSIARTLRLPIPDLLFGIDEFQPLNGAKGWHTFGFAPRPFTETIRDTLAWFRANGYS